MGDTFWCQLDQVKLKAKTCLYITWCKASQLSTQKVMTTVLQNNRHRALCKTIKTQVNEQPKQTNTQADKTKTKSQATYFPIQSSSHQGTLFRQGSITIKWGTTVSGRETEYSTWHQKERHKRLKIENQWAKCSLQSSQFSSSFGLKVYGTGWFWRLGDICKFGHRLGNMISICFVHAGMLWFLKKSWIKNEADYTSKSQILLRVQV